MHSFDATFHRLLTVAIGEEVDRLRAIITDKPLGNYENYCLYVGRLDGLRITLRLAADVEQRLQGAA